MFLHELAHAWDRQSLTDERRAEFLRLRRLDASGATTTRSVWDERGAEHAAEVMVWGLMDRPYRRRRSTRTAAPSAPGLRHADRTANHCHAFTAKC